MKKISLFVFALFVTTVSFGQFRIQVKGGANLVTAKNVAEFRKKKIGWYAGLTSNIAFSKKMSLIPELLYSSKGWRTISFYGQKTIRIRLNYLDAPILLRYSICKRTHLVMGPEFGYLLNASEARERDSRNVTHQFPGRFDLGIVIGLKHDIMNTLGVEARYVFGITQFYQNDGVVTPRSGSPDANRVFQCGIVYHLFR
jgi:hypothetical protein